MHCATCKKQLVYENMEQWAFCKMCYCSFCTVLCFNRYRQHPTSRDYDHVNGSMEQHPYLTLSEVPRDVTNEEFKLNHWATQCRTCGLALMDTWWSCNECDVRFCSDACKCDHNPIQESNKEEDQEEIIDITSPPQPLMVASSEHRKQRLLERAERRKAKEKKDTTTSSASFSCMSGETATALDASRMGTEHEEWKRTQTREVRIAKRSIRRSKAAPYHTGAPGLGPGGRILPPFLTKRAKTAPSLQPAKKWAHERVDIPTETKENTEWADFFGLSKYFAGVWLCSDTSTPISTMTIQDYVSLVDNVKGGISGSAPKNSHIWELLSLTA